MAGLDPAIQSRAQRSSNALVGRLACTVTLLKSNNPSFSRHPGAGRDPSKLGICSEI
jgi:hypothetical protein